MKSLLHGREEKTDTTMQAYKEKNMKAGLGFLIQTHKSQIWLAELHALPI